MLVRDVSGFVLHAGTEGQEGLPSVADDQPQAISLLIMSFNLIEQLRLCRLDRAPIPNVICFNRG
jgi:hypothetical protein